MRTTLSTGPRLLGKVYFVLPFEINPPTQPLGFDYLVKHNVLQMRWLEILWGLHPFT